jgi:flavorubredoxin
MKEKPELVSYQVELSQYKRIILATPVWAGTFAPPLRTFLQENDLTGKRFALAACSSGGSTQGCFKKLMAELKIAQVDATLSLIDPKTKPSPDNRKRIEAFCGKLQ